MLQQLLYTYAARGLDGKAGFQPVAATEGLRSGGRALLDHVRSVCRYDRPTSGKFDPADVVSYGWFDVGEVRVAFRRVYTGFDEFFNRPGNFAAHVLVGAAQQLPADRLLAAYASPSWWAGDLTAVPDDGRLDPASLNDFTCADRSGNADDGITLLTAMLAQRSRLVIAEPSGRVASALALIANRLPALIDPLNVSTYEAAGQVNRFAVAGIGPAPGGRSAVMTFAAASTDPRLSPHRGAAEYALSDDPRTRAAIQRAWVSCQTARGPDVSRFLRLCSTAAAAAKGDRSTLEDLLPSLDRPDTALDLLEHDNVRGVIAAALAEVDQRAWTAVRGIAVDLPTEVMCALADGLGKCSRARPATFGEIGNAVAELGNVAFAAFMTHAIAAADEKPELVRSWPAPLVAAAAGEAAGRRTLSPLDLAVVERGSYQLDRHARDADVDDSVWVRMCARALDDGRVRPAAVVRLLQAEPGRTSVVVDELQEQHLSALFDVATPDDAAALLAAVHDTPVRPDLFGHLLCRTVPRLSVPEQSHVLALGRDALGRRAPDGVHDLVLDVVRGRVAYELVHPSVGRSKSLIGVARRTDPPPIAAWYDVIDAAAGRIGIMACPRLIERMSGPDRSLAARYLMDAFAGRSPDVAGVDRVVHALADDGYSEPNELARALLIAALRAVVAYGKPDAGTAVLTYVADVFIDQKKLARTITGGIKDPVIVQMAEEVVGALLALGPSGQKRLAGAGVTRGGADWINSMVKRTR